MAENKTRPTGASVGDYIASRADSQQRADCRELMALLRKVTRKSPKMWGPSIVGFGAYHYVYPSGREGDAPLLGFALRGRELVLYVMGCREEKQLLSRLGKYKASVSCIYIKRLDDIDRKVLEQLARASITQTRKLYG